MDRFFAPLRMTYKHEEEWIPAFAGMTCEEKKNNFLKEI